MLIKFENDQVRVLEIFTSTFYFAAMRDNWEEMIKHAESCLEQYMVRLPLDYRSKPLPDQPDIVWGHRVLPNFRHTLEELNKAYIKLTHGDMNALGYANNIRSDFKGQLDYEAEWMSEFDKKTYDDNIYSTVVMAHNISLTEDAGWRSVDPSRHQDELERFSKLLPSYSYGINRNISVRSGEKTPRTGIYAPDVENSSPQFLNARYSRAPLASVYVGSEDLIDPTTKEKYDEQKIFKKTECKWYLIECSEENQEFVSPPVDPIQLFRVAAGQPFPQTGYYFTPALPNSRRHFIEGQTAPSLDSTYGQTIWQWDEVQ